MTRIFSAYKLPLEMRSRTRLGSFKRDRCLEIFLVFAIMAGCLLDMLLDGPCRHFNYLDANISVVQIFFIICF